MNHDTLTAKSDLDAARCLDQLENRVQSKLSGRIHNLQLLRHAYGIVLRGFARTYYAKQLAQHAVMTESELPILANEIEVG
jgi:fructose-1,6-bisphosphatase